MKIAIPKLSVRYQSLFAVPRFTTIIKLSQYSHKLSHRASLFSTQQSTDQQLHPEHISEKAFDRLPQFNSALPLNGYNPRNMLFVQDVTASKQSLFSFFNKVGRQSPVDRVPVFKIKIFAEQKLASILFKDAKSVDHVLQQQLTFDGKPLILSRHKMVEYWNLMEPSKTKLLIRFSEPPETTPEELEQFLANKLADYGKDFLIQPFIKFAFKRDRGVMAFPTEHDAAKALKILRNTAYKGQGIHMRHMKTKEIKDAQHQQLILVTEDQLNVALKDDAIGVLHPEASALISELLNLGYSFKNAPNVLVARTLKHLRFTRELDLLKIVCGQVTEGIGLHQGASQQMLLGSLVQTWAFLKNTRQVEECVQILKRNFPELHFKTYQSLMEAYRLIKNYEKLLQLYEFLRSQKLTTASTIASVLKYFATEKDIQSMFNVIEEVQADPSLNYIATWHYVILLNAAREANQFDKIPTIIQHMKQNNIPLDFKVNTAILHAHAAAGDIASTLKCFEEIKVHGWIPFAYHYHYIMKAYKNAKFFDGQMKWFRKLLEDGLIPTPGIMMTMLSSAMAEKREEEIQEILDAVKLSPQLQRSQPIIDLVRKYNRCKQTEEPWEDPREVSQALEEEEKEEEDGKQRQSASKVTMDV